MKVAALDSSRPRQAALVAITDRHGWTLQPCEGPRAVLNALDDGSVDMVLLNWADLQRHTEDIVEHLFSVSEVPMVAIADDDEGVKAALQLGAALGLRVPSDLEVLVLSMRALLQQRPLPATLNHRLKVGDLVVHLANHTVERRGRRQVLSPTEWQLFAFLLAHPERTFDREQLACGAWGEGFGGRHAEIDLYVFRLRRKVEARPRQPLLVETVRNFGYRLTVVPLPLSAV